MRIHFEIDNQPADQTQQPTKIDHHLAKLTTAAQQNKNLDLLNEQANQQVFGTTWNSQRVIPTPQISLMQSMFTESNTLPTNEQATKPTTYQSERSQLNQNTNHFSTLAISAIIIASLIAALLFTGNVCV